MRVFHGPRRPQTGQDRVLWVQIWLNALKIDYNVNITQKVLWSIH